MGVIKSRACSVELDDDWADDILEYHEEAGKKSKRHGGKKNH